jgi:hypothetical protein
MSTRPIKKLIVHAKEPWWYLRAGMVLTVRIARILFTDAESGARPPDTLQGWKDVLGVLRSRELRTEFRTAVHKYAVVSARVSRTLADISLLRSSINDPRRALVRIQISPGWCLHRLAALAFSRQTFETVIEPTLSDMQTEFFEALHEKRPLKARWVQCRGYWNFWCTVAGQLPISMMKLLVTLWRLIP